MDRRVEKQSYGVIAPLSSTHPIDGCVPSGLVSHAVRLVASRTVFSNGIRKWI